MEMNRGTDSMAATAQPATAGGAGTGAAAHRFDPYRVTADGIQEAPSSLLQALRRIGPGLILAASIVGTGELIATTHVGARAGFALLWLVILSCFIKIFVQVELGRYAISSGETTIASFNRLPGPGRALGWWWCLMMLATQAQLAAMLGGIGQAAHMIHASGSQAVAESLGVAARPELPWSVLTTLIAVALLAAGSYKLVERTSTIMVAMFTFMTVVCVVLLPWTGHALTWGDVASGLTFDIPEAAIAAAVVMFGITGVGASELIAYPYWCIEKGYARFAGPRDNSAAWSRRAAGWMRVLKLDAWVSMIIYMAATIAFYLLGAAILHGETGGAGLPGSVAGMLETLARMYVPVLGEQAAVWLIVAGAFAALYSTFFAATAANIRTLVDLLHLNGIIRLEGWDDRRRWIRRFCIGFPFLNLALFIWFPNPVRLVIVGGFAQALTLPMIACAAVYLRYRRTDRRITSGLLWDLFLWLSMLAFFATALYGVWDSYSKLV